jgi:hypothetical protein
MKILFALLLVPFLVSPAFAATPLLPEDYEQIVSSEQGTLKIGLSVEKSDSISKLYIGWINPMTNKIQEHIDYTVKVVKDGENIFGPIPLTHTSLGEVKIPVEFTSLGEHMVIIEMEGILFQPIPLETTVFTINVGEEQIVTTEDESTEDESTEGGGCLIATAAYGSEMAPQVQFLREIRDNTVLQTQSGTSFMTAFNQFYYTFSPAIADYERENPVFKEAVKVGLTPLLASLTILNYVDIDTEQEMLGYGIGIIMLNIGMYFVAPAVVIIALSKKLRK